MAESTLGDPARSETEIPHLPFKIDATQILAAFAGYLYVAGYLISAITLRNYGIQRFEAVKLQYVEVGITFTVLSLVLTVLPAAACLVHFRVRLRAKLPNYRLGAIGYLLNTLNLFALLIVFAVFITSHEWTSSIRHLPGWSLGSLFYVYAGFAVFEIAIMPIGERLIIKHISNVLAIYRWVVEPLRYSIVGLGFAFDALLVTNVSWLGSVVRQAVPFILSLWALCAGCGGVLYWLRKVGTRRVFALILVLGGTGVLALFYVCVNAYVFGVVRAIPINRGGKLPVTVAHLISDNPVLSNLPLKQEKKNSATAWGPVYVLEESPEFLYVVGKDQAANWTSDWVSIIAIKKDVIQFILHERVRDGHPRTLILGKTR